MSIFVSINHQILVCRHLTTIILQAVNPDIDLNPGQSAVLTCAIHTHVDSKNIRWYKDGESWSEGVSWDRWVVLPVTTFCES